MEKYEKNLVEDYVSENLEMIGWKFVKPDELKRENMKEVLLCEDLISAIKRINKDKNVGEEEIKKTIDEIKLLSNQQEGIKNFLHYLKYGIGIKFEKERVVKIVDLIDYERPENNEFIFSRQVHFKGNDLIIPDIVLFINGIPVCDIECKSPVDLKTDWYSAYKQIKNYEKIVPELYKYIQIGISFSDKVRYFAIVPWKDQGEVYKWRKDDLPQDKAIFEFLSPDIFLDILRNFLFIREQYGEMKKVICRYMQFRAVNKIYNRVIENLKGIEDKNKGLIWHWQGSGKTLTMLFATHKLYFDRNLEKPTIFIIVDRKELEEQMKEEISSLKLNFSFEVIENVNGLKEILSYDNFKGKRGIFLTLIHKFRPDEIFLPDNFYETISQRKNVICFIDEVHRSQYGILASCMKNILKRAFYFGFTGTPIAENERNTYNEFGYPLKDEGYLDKYFIEESQNDGFTLPLCYQVRLENLHIPEDNLKFFIEKWEEDEFKGDIDLYPKISEKVRKKLNHINLFLENEERIKKICEDISKHFKENIDGKFKGMIVCGSRKACIFYKKYIDQFLPPIYSEVVMTFGIEDKEPLKSFYNEWRGRNPKFSDDEIIKNIIENFKEKEYPKILIVTDMLITGFDASVLQVIYLDKLLKKHRLLQAIARTNRPYGDLKEIGLIIDYVGILKHLNYALKDYYKSDIKGLIVEFDKLLKEFEKCIENMRGIFKGIEFEIKRENLLKSIEILRDDRLRNRFFENYKKSRKIFEILASHPEKLKYLNEFKWFSAVYNYYRKLTEDEEEKGIVERFFNKTVEFVHKSFEVNEIKKEFPEIKFDLKTLEEIKKSVIPEKEKVINIIFILSKFILTEKSKNPIYKSIADRVEDLIRRWKERKIELESLFKEEKEIVDEILKKEKEKGKYGFDNFEYGIFLILKDEIKDERRVKDYVEIIKNTIKDDMIENWVENQALKQSIEKKTREICIKIKNEYNLEYEKFDLLHRKIIEFIKEYGS